MNSNEYPYKGLPLNKPIIRNLLLQRFADEGFQEFKKMIEDVVQHHRQHGGADTQLKNLSATFSRVLSELEQETSAERHPKRIQGVWQIHTPPADPPAAADTPRRQEPSRDTPQLQQFLSRELAQLEKQIAALQTRRDEIASLLGRFPSGRGVLETGETP